MVKESLGHKGNNNVGDGPLAAEGLWSLVRYSVDARVNADDANGHPSGL